MRRVPVKVAMRVLCALVVFLAAPRFGVAQTTQSEQPGAQPSIPTAPDSSTNQPMGDDPSPGDAFAVFPHSDTSRYWISGQGNVVFQWHPSFHAQYSGPNSLSPGAQSATTHILTLYTGYELSHTTEIFADVDDATGGGIGTALGLAGYTNLDSVRTVQGIALSKAPYLARLILRQIIPL